MNKVWVILLLAVSITATPSPAQTDMKVSIEHVNTARFPLTRVFFRVLRGYEPVRGLVQEDITVRADGRIVTEVSHGSVFSSREWIGIALVMDVSGSMKGEALARAKEAALAFIARAGVQDRISLTTFGQEARLIEESTNEHQRVREKINALEARGNTALRDALILAVDHVAGLPVQRRFVVLLTDGKDTSSRNDESTLMKRLAKHKLPVYTVGLGRGVNRKLLDHIASATGGASRFAQSPEQLVSVYLDIAKDLESIYFAEFNFPLQDEAGRSGVHDVVVAVTVAGETMQGRTRFYPANAVFGGEGASAAVTPPQTAPVQQKPAITDEAPNQGWLAGLKKQLGGFAFLLPLLTGLLLGVILLLILRPRLWVALITILLAQVLAWLAWFLFIAD